MQQGLEASNFFQQFDYTVIPRRLITESTFCLKAVDAIENVLTKQA